MRKLTSQEYQQAKSDHDCGTPTGDGCEVCLQIEQYEQDNSLVTKERYEELKREHEPGYECKDGGCTDCDDIYQYEQDFINDKKALISQEEE